MIFTFELYDILLVTGRLPQVADNIESFIKQDMGNSRSYYQLYYFELN